LAAFLPFCFYSVLCINLKDFLGGTVPREKEQAKLNFVFQTTIKKRLDFCSKMAKKSMLNHFMYCFHHQAKFANKGQ
jgi:hypothetical protein